MITLKEWMEIADYRITEGSDYMWNCYGQKAYQLSSWNGEHDGFSFAIVFDTFDQTVYEVEVCDYAKNRAYRIINPLVRNEHEGEADARNINFNEAWDDVNYIDLEVAEDMLEKARAIAAEEEYDTRVQVPVDFTDQEMLTYMKLAHELDITFNELVERALREAISAYEEDRTHEKPKKHKKKKKD
jgi:hypothetical protein